MKSIISKKSKIFLAGHNGLVGSAILKELKFNNFNNIFYENRTKLNLENQNEVNKYFKKNFDLVIIAAARVGGIKSNLNNQSDYLLKNLQIQNNLISASFQNNVKNLIFLGSSCIYPVNAKQPYKENSILSGKLEQTNEGYAIAKIAGIKLCQYLSKKFNLNYFSLMPPNIYGDNDNFKDDNSHFIPAAIRKIYEAKKNKKKKVIFWGDGTPRREIMHVEDLAKAVCFFIKKKPKHNLINVGLSNDKKIIEYLNIISKYLKYDGKIIFDGNKKLNGVKKKLMCSKLAYSYGWKPTISVNNGLQKVIKKYTQNYDKTNK